MKIEIQLSETEVKEILIKEFAPAYPDKVFDVDIRAYAGATIEIREPEKIEAEKPGEVTPEGDK